MTSIIEAGEGTVGDFIGDAVFAFWNAPIACGPRHAMICVEAAVAQQERLVELRKGWAELGLPCFKVRMGINSGKCLAGNVGSRTRLKYTLIGDAVNLASRLEGLGKHYGCYLTISENTFQEPEVAHTFCARILDIVAVAGKEQPTIIREVLARRHEATEEQLELERLSEAMMDAYLCADIESCRKLLQLMKAIKSNDVSINGMFARLQKLASTGFPVGWTGVLKMKLK
jgi:adenylate cyclase